MFNASCTIRSWHRLARYVITCLMCLSPLGMCGSAGAQENGLTWQPALRMAEATDTVSRAMGLLSLAGWGCSTSHVAFCGASLAAGGEAELTITLDAGTEYMFVAGGDSNCTDLDIEIREYSTNNVLAEDTAVDAAPVVSYRPGRSERVSVRLRMFRATGTSCAVMVVAQKGGWEIPPSVLKEATIGCLLACAVGSALVDGGATWHDEPGEWALWGTVLDSGQEQAMTMMRMKRGNHLFVSIGDDSLERSCLYLLDGEGNALRADEDQDARKFIQYETEAHYDYGVLVQNVKSKGPSLVYVAVMDY